MRATKIARIIFGTVDQLGEATGLGPVELIGEFGTGILDLAGVDVDQGLPPAEIWAQIISAKDAELARMNQSVMSAREKLERNRRREVGAATNIVPDPPDETVTDTDINLSSKDDSQ